MPKSMKYEYKLCLLLSQFVAIVVLGIVSCRVLVSSRRIFNVNHGALSFALPNSTKLDGHSTSSLNEHISGVASNGGSRFSFNRYPNFVCGKYAPSLVNLNFLDCDSWGSLEINEKLTICHAIGNVKLVVARRGGIFSIYDYTPPNGITYQKADEGEESPKQSRFMSNLGYNTLQHMVSPFGKNGNAIQEWLEDIKTMPLGIVQPEKIVDNAVAYKTNVDICGLLEAYRGLIVQYVGPNPPNAVPLEWFYEPKDQLAVFRFLLPTTPYIFDMKFNLLPGTKSLRIHGAKVVVFKAPNGVGNTRVKGCDIMLQGSCAIHPQVDDIRGCQGETVTRDGTATVFTFTGDRKNRFNQLYRIMQRLSMWIRTGHEGQDPIPPLTCRDISTSHGDIALSMLNVCENGRLKFFIPMLVFQDVTSGKTYLCNRGFEINTPPNPKMWYPWNQPYPLYNFDMVPYQYRNVAFVDSAEMSFNVDTIHAIIASLRPLQHLDIKGYLGHDKDQNKTQIKDIFYIGHPKKSTLNLVY